MLDRKDAEWWVLEAQKHPESVIDLIRLLADRLAFLDKQNEALRSEMITLRRNQQSSADTEALRQRIRDLEAVLQQGTTGVQAGQLLLYGHDSIEFSGQLDATTTIGRKLENPCMALTCHPQARLLVITDDSQLFSLTFSDLPVPTGSPALLGNPRNIAVILDQGVVEQHRFLTLLTQKGYVYSILTATIATTVKRQGKLIPHLIPGDPIIAAAPSHNQEVIVLSRMGRWTRFAERSVSSTGSQSMELPKGDSFVGLTTLSQEPHIIFLTADGKIFVRPSQDLKGGKTPGASRGMLAKGQSFVGIGTGDSLTVVTHQGKVQTLKTSALPLSTQTERGYALPGLDKDDAVAAFALR